MCVRVFMNRPVGNQKVLIRAMLCNRTSYLVIHIIHNENLTHVFNAVKNISEVLLYIVYFKILISEKWLCYFFIL